MSYVTIQIVTRIHALSKWCLLDLRGTQQIWGQRHSELLPAPPLRDGYVTRAYHRRTTCDLLHRCKNVEVKI